MSNRRFLFLSLIFGLGGLGVILGMMYVRPEVKADVVDIYGQEREEELTAIEEEKLNSTFEIESMSPRTGHINGGFTVVVQGKRIPADAVVAVGDEVIKGDDLMVSEGEGGFILFTAPAVEEAGEKEVWVLSPTKGQVQVEGGFVYFE